jgi:hypothetical protein
MWEGNSYVLHTISSLDSMPCWILSVYELLAKSVRGYGRKTRSSKVIRIQGGHLGSCLSPRRPGICRHRRDEYRKIGVKGPNPADGFRKIMIQPKTLPSPPLGPAGREQAPARTATGLLVCRAP